MKTFSFNNIINNPLYKRTIKKFLAGGITLEEIDNFDIYKRLEELKKEREERAIRAGEERKRRLDAENALRYALHRPSVQQERDMIRSTIQRDPQISYNFPYISNLSDVKLPSTRSLIMPYSKRYILPDLVVGLNPQLTHLGDDYSPKYFNYSFNKDDFKPKLTIKF